MRDLLGRLTIHSQNQIVREQIHTTQLIGAESQSQEDSPLVKLIVWLEMMTSRERLIKVKEEKSIESPAAPTGLTCTSTIGSQPSKSYLKSKSRESRKVRSL